EAKQMLGRTPGNIAAIRPAQGVAVNVEARRQLQEMAPVNHLRVIRPGMPG
ncbi:rod shape-determining protein, partial [Klebsiella pneumoniae]|nr:rod shape-determining protein [Klebsiella pneumoniae]